MEPDAPMPSALPPSERTQRALQSLIDSVPALRSCLPELMALRDAVEQRGDEAIAELSPLVRHLLLERLRAIPRGTTGEDVEALLASLETVERRKAPRAGTLQNLVSTPEMYAAEIPLEEFQKAAGG